MLFYITRKHRMQLNTEHIWLACRLRTSYFRQTDRYAFRMAYISTKGLTPTFRQGFHFHKLCVTDVNCWF